MRGSHGSSEGSIIVSPERKNQNKNTAYPELDNFAGLPITSIPILSNIVIKNTGIVDRRVEHHFNSGKFSMKNTDRLDKNQYISLSTIATTVTDQYNLINLMEPNELSSLFAPSLKMRDY